MDNEIPVQSACPTCGGRLYSEHGDLEPAVIRDARRWRWLRAQQGWPDTEAAAGGAAPEWFDALADAGLDERR